MTTFPQPGFDVAPAQPTRTSIAAILSLVCGVLGLIACCIPVVSPALGVVGLLFAVFAFLSIGRSNGAVGGRGIAVGGLVCSIVTVVLGIFMVFGMNMVVNMIGAYGKVVEMAQSDDTTGLSEALSSGTASAITPEDIENFKAESGGSLGKYQRVTPGMMALFGSFGKLGPIAGSIPSQYQQGGSGYTMLPMPGEFEKGKGLIIVVVNQGEQTPQWQMGKVVNIGVAPDGGPITWLVDPASLP
ncbi:MAG: DUF4190 domain-containing protein [Planctomycetota bacterium]|nr:DUF4190 domain-containing protein [Planctomycetota bacterium]